MVLCCEQLNNHCLIYWISFSPWHDEYNGKWAGYILKSPKEGSHLSTNSDLVYFRERKRPNHHDLCSTAAKELEERFSLFISRDAIKAERMSFNVHPDNMLRGHNSWVESGKCLHKAWKNVEIHRTQCDIKTRTWKKKKKRVKGWNKAFYKKKKKTKQK